MAFDGFEMIDTYTREQAVADGVLVDVSDTEAYRDNHILFPVCLTIAVYVNCVQQVESDTEAEDWRLFDILAMFRYGTRGIGTVKRISESEFHYIVTIRNKDVILKALCHPGDNAEPVITIMYPNED